jgi:hypothetical protein
VNIHGKLLEDLRDQTQRQNAVLDPVAADGDEGGHDVGEPLRVEHHQVLQLLFLVVDDAAGVHQELRRHREGLGDDAALFPPARVGLKVHVLLVLLLYEVVELHPGLGDHHLVLFDDVADGRLQFGDALAGLAADGEGAHHAVEDLLAEALPQVSEDALHGLGAQRLVVQMCPHQEHRGLDAVAGQGLDLAHPVLDARRLRTGQVEDQDVDAVARQEELVGGVEHHLPPQVPAAEGGAPARDFCCFAAEVCRRDGDVPVDFDAVRGQVLLHVHFPFLGFEAAQ